ncbi:MAG TPA: tannase/feruloyl esterase family alpha/beta hydrolase, partial [Anaeromyxobacteraceae bacterium]
GMSPALEPIRDGGKKILMWHGTADQRITFESSLDYYVRVAGHFGNGGPDFAEIQPWFRYVLAPGVAHCGSGTGPQPQQLFGAMVSWVEQGTAPDGLVASKAGMTRPLCSFPQTAVYKGGDPNVAASFHCEGNLQTPSAIQNGRYVRYKHETGDELGTYGGPP